MSEQHWKQVVVTTAALTGAVVTFWWMCRQKVKSQSNARTIMQTPPPETRPPHPQSLVQEPPKSSQTQPPQPSPPQIPPAQIQPFTQQASFPTTLTQEQQPVPPFCEELISSQGEALFTIAFSDLEAQGNRGVVSPPLTPRGSVGNRDFEIHSLGKPLLKAKAHGRSVTIGLGRSMLGSIAQAIETQPGSLPAAMLIKSKAHSTYGELQASGPLQFTLICSGAPVLKVLFQTETGQFSVVTPDAQVAFAVRCTTSDIMSGKDHLQVRVKAGHDAVLITLCIIGVIIFALPDGAGDIPPSIPPNHNQ